MLACSQCTGDPLGYINGINSREVYALSQAQNTVIKTICTDAIGLLGDIGITASTWQKTVIAMACHVLMANMAQSVLSEGASEGKCPKSGDEQDDFDNTDDSEESGMEDTPDSDPDDSAAGADDASEDSSEFAELFEELLGEE